MHTLDCATLQYTIAHICAQPILGDCLSVQCCPKKPVAAAAVWGWRITFLLGSSHTCYWPALFLFTFYFQFFLLTFDFFLRNMPGSSHTCCWPALVSFLVFNFILLVFTFGFFLRFLLGSSHTHFLPQFFSQLTPSTNLAQESKFCAEISMLIFYTFHSHRLDILNIPCINIFSTPF